MMLSACYIITTALKAIPEKKGAKFLRKKSYYFERQRLALECTLHLIIMPCHYYFKENYDSQFEQVPAERETFQEVL